MSQDEKRSQEKVFEDPLLLSAASIPRVKTRFKIIYTIANVLFIAASYALGMVFSSFSTSMNDPYGILFNLDYINYGITGFLIGMIFVGVVGLIPGAKYKWPSENISLGIIIAGLLSLSVLLFTLLMNLSPVVITVASLSVFGVFAVGFRGDFLRKWLSGRRRVDSESFSATNRKKSQDDVRVTTSLSLYESLQTSVLRASRENVEQNGPVDDITSLVEKEVLSFFPVGCDHDSKAIARSILEESEIQTKLSGLNAQSSEKEFSDVATMIKTAVLQRAVSHTPLLAGNNSQKFLDSRRLSGPDEKQVVNDAATKEKVVVVKDEEKAHCVHDSPSNSSISVGANPPFQENLTGQGATLSDSEDGWKDSFMKKVQERVTFFFPRLTNKTEIAGVANKILMQESISRIVLKLKAKPSSNPYLLIWEAINKELLKMAFEEKFTGRFKKYLNIEENGIDFVEEVKNIMNKWVQEKINSLAFDALKKDNLLPWECSLEGNIFTLNWKPLSEHIEELQSGKSEEKISLIGEEGSGLPKEKSLTLEEKEQQESRKFLEDTLKEFNITPARDRYFPATTLPDTDVRMRAVHKVESIVLPVPLTGENPHLLLPPTRPTGVRQEVDLTGAVTENKDNGSLSKDT